MDAAEPAIELARIAAIVAGENPPSLVSERDVVVADTFDKRVRASSERVEALVDGQIAPARRLELLRRPPERFALCGPRRNDGKELAFGSRQAVTDRRVLLEKADQRRRQKRHVR